MLCQHISNFIMLSVAIEALTLIAVKLNVFILIVIAPSTHHYLT
jgi:hypothetical protein